MLVNANSRRLAEFGGISFGDGAGCGDPNTSHYDHGSKSYYCDKTGEAQWCNSQFPYSQDPHNNSNCREYRFYWASPNTILGAAQRGIPHSGIPTGAAGDAGQAAGSAAGGLFGGKSGGTAGSTSPSGTPTSSPAGQGPAGSTPGVMQTGEKISKYLLLGGIGLLGLALVMSKKKGR